MLLSEIIQAANFKITEGSEFLWQCFGQEARILDFGYDNQSSVSCIFDAKNQRVYEVNIYSNNDTCYRWIDEEFIDAIKKESDEKNVDFSIAIDDVKWVDLENLDDVFRKTTQIVETGTCDNEVTITLDLSEDLLLHLSLMAHKKNITLNSLIVEIIEDKLKEELTINEKFVSEEKEDNTTKTYITELKEAPDGSGDLLVDLPQEILDSADLKEGDEIDLEVLENKIIIKKSIKP